ncbi:hypothetical protein PspLS_10335 [Pyricularia sp. CBS 133598]|nr:hypothetical protein PspLS_10335 [Pyricularia sp. CBS 133598]
MSSDPVALDDFYTKGKEYHGISSAVVTHSIVNRFQNAGQSCLRRDMLLVDIYDGQVVLTVTGEPVKRHNGVLVLVAIHATSLLAGANLEHIGGTPRHAFHLNLALKVRSKVVADVREGPIPVSPWIGVVERADLLGLAPGT